MTKAMRMLPLAIASVLGLQACNSGSDTPEVTAKSLEFVGMPAPSTDAEMAKTYSKAIAKVTYSDNSVKEISLNYKTLLLNSDVFNGKAIGGVSDVSGNPIYDNSVPNSPSQFISDTPDGNSLLQVAGAAATGKGGNPLFLVNHFEYVTTNNKGHAENNAAANDMYQRLPMHMGLSTIDQNTSSGDLSVVTARPISFASVDGLWTPCASSVSPWNTHLGSEEYEPDARAWEKSPVSTSSTTDKLYSFLNYYFQDPTKFGSSAAYHYGLVPEVTVKADGSTQVVKHYSMGRIARELVEVMPDKRTVYQGDDGSYTMMVMFVADKENDLSAGTLYAAKWTQLPDAQGGNLNGGKATLTWVRLGSSNDSEIKALVDRGIKFSDIFETADKATSGFTTIKTYPGVLEHLRVKSGMEKAAAFLETRRYGAILGATSEFNKFEGVAVNAKDKKVYFAMAYIEKSMLRNSSDPVDDIHVNQISSGAVYELALSSGVKDTQGNSINSDYVGSSISVPSELYGIDLSTPDGAGNTADVNRVANPDNLKFSEKYRTLFIGEDSGMHVNNFLWAFNLDTRKLSRILSLPAGAESTGLQAVDNLNNFSYVMSSYQHAGDYTGKPSADTKARLDALINKRQAAIGYLALPFLP